MICEDPFHPSVKFPEQTVLGTNVPGSNMLFLQMMFFQKRIGDQYIMPRDATEVVRQRLAAQLFNVESSARNKR